MKDNIIRTIRKHIEFNWTVDTVNGKPTFTFDLNNSSLDKIATLLEPEVNFVSSDVPISGGAWAILHKGQIYKNLFFTSLKEARNKIKFDYPKKRFKEETENILVCAYYGTTFKIIEIALHRH